ncbi:MAG: hypothetical protein P1S59_08420 [bacterium]|nr:hypothetical protein [bacterium]
MSRYRNASFESTLGVCLLILVLLGLSAPGTLFAGHKLQDSQCYDCHIVGGSIADAVLNSRLIRGGDAMTEIINGGWSTGSPLPCIYCHDDAPRTVRENMIGVKEDFTAVSISKHPVAPYTSNTAGADATLDCIDCHDVSVVSYVAGGSAPGTTLSPNVHNQNVAAVGWTPEPGNLDYRNTYMNASTAASVSPLNSLNNTFCTKQCHDNTTGTGFDAGQVYHQYNNPVVSLENGSNFFTASQIAGCLNETATGSGCHAVHNARSNTDLITAVTWGTSTPIARDNCGSCHVFDDGGASSPLPRSSSDFATDGHGQVGIGLNCLNCHDSSIPHFQADGTPSVGDSAGRLTFVLDNTPSGFSTPAKSRLSICVSSSCHDGYLEHAPSTSGSYPVGCLDCHDPHGYGVGSNIRMMRQQAPIASPTVTLSYANSGDWYNSAQSSGFTNWACDSADCHPLSVNQIMSTSGTNPAPHGGGTGLKSGCENCHKHQGGEYSWAATGCDQCHGASGSSWPSDTSSADDGGTTPNNAGRHPLHRQEIAAALGYSPTTTNDGQQKTMCRYCHQVGDSDHTSATRAEVFPAGYAKAIWDTATETPSETNAAFVAGTDAGTCNDVDCHNNKSTSGVYQWYQSGSADCVMCHTAGGFAGNIANPVSGLHDETPKVSAAAHDESFAYSSGALTGDCQTCHPTPPSTRHLNGVDNSTINSTATTAVALTAGVGFADAATPTCSPSIAGCHLEQLVGESWTRLWHESADQTDGTECAGCHGDFTVGWTTGTMHATAPSTKGNGTHANTGLLTYECTDCHAIGDATPNYAFTSSTNDWDQNAAETSNHGNALISMNVNGTAWTRAAGRSGCPQCHGGPGTAYDFGQTSWTADTVSGDVPPVGCDGCHGVSGLYWPEIASVQTTDYPDRRGSHAAHIDALEAKLAYDATPAVYTTNDAEQRHMCEYCHNDANGVGGSDHWDNVIPADVGDMNPMWDTTAGAPITTDTDAAIASSKTCAGVDCHYNRTTPDTWFNGGGTSDCTTCHYNGNDTGTLVNAHPGSGRHGTHVASNTYVPNDCASCHGANANNPPLGDTAHWSGTPNYGNSLTSYTAPDCANACHDVVPASYGDWLDLPTDLDCLNCHSGSWIAGIYTPTSGLHTITPTVSGIRHAEALSPASRCEVCHTTIAAGQATHINGTWQADQAANTESRGLYDDYSDGSPGSCSNTGGVNEVGATGCHDGPGEVGSWSRMWDTSAANSDGSECANCHGGFVGQAWTFGAAADTGDGSVSHNFNYNGTGGSEVLGNHADTAADGTTCNICHVYADSPYNSAAWANTWHGNDQIDMNDAMGYSQTNWDCSSNCHVGGTPIAMEDSGWTVNPVTGPALSCTSCHGASNPSAGVGTNSSHLATVTGGSPQACESCHPGNLKGGTHSKSGDTGVVVIRNYPAVGVTYSHQPDGTNYGFVLGGDATAGTTEAQICWGCHDQNNDGLWGSGDVSEWGTNVSVVTGSITFDYGSLNQVNWVGALWSSANFSYKNSTVQSTHSADSSVGVSGTDSVSNIRCSYCHDVHNTARNRSSVITTTMDPDGEPYLRGRWRGNPFNEDGAPQSGNEFVEIVDFGNVPRARPVHDTSTTKGGYWIDQNSGSPTSSWTVDDFGGLCEYCHGGGNGSWADTEINSINEFGSAGSDWVSGYNGHANAVKGGSIPGAGTEYSARNIFGDGIGGRPVPVLNTTGRNWDSTIVGNLNEKGQQSTGEGLWIRGQAAGNKPTWYPLVAVAPGAVPPLVDTGQAKVEGLGADAWNLTVDSSTTQDNYHNFPCSKCHNPHASRLPRLMITNCLDVSHNTWDDTRIGPPSDLGSAETGVTIDREMSDWSSAVNCHRLDSDGTPGTGSDGGWNRVTPW